MKLTMVNSGLKGLKLCHFTWGLVVQEHISVKPVYNAEVINITMVSDLSKNNTNAITTIMLNTKEGTQSD